MRGNSDQLQMHLTDWAHMMAIDCAAAQSEIIISAFSILPPSGGKPGEWSRLWQSWVDAALRGVNVIATMNEPLHVHRATHNNARTAEYLAIHGIKTRFARGNKVLHFKSMVIDSNLVWLGSGNFTAAAVSHNHEGYMRAVSPDFAARIKERWAAIW